MDWIGGGCVVGWVSCWLGVLLSELFGLNECIVTREYLSGLMAERTKMRMMKSSDSGGKGKWHCSDTSATNT